MNIDVNLDNGVTVLVVDGRIDSETSALLGDVLRDASSENNQLVLDMASVEYINSAGLREIVAVFKSVRAQGGDLRLAAASSRVREVFEVSGLASLFSMHGTIAEAVASFSTT